MNDINSAPAPVIEERVFQLVAEESEKPRETLDRNTVLGDELFDSLDMVEIIMALEDEFEISIADEEAQQIRTIGQLVDAVEAKLSGVSAKPQHDGNTPSSS